MESVRRETKERLMGEFFGIDEAEAEKERRMILASIKQKEE